MALTYAQFVTDLANFLVVPETDTAFIAALPNIIADAENRLYRELDLLNARVTATTPFVANNRNLTLPTPANGQPFVVVEQMNVITAAGVTDPDQGTRNPMTPCSKEVLDVLWPSSTGSGLPTLFAPVTQTSWIVGPWPDAAYTVEVVGTFQPEALSATNPTTLLSTYLEDVFFAAALVMSAGYQLNFSAGGDNPASGVTWESHVQTLLSSAKKVEFRKKFGSEGWTSKEPDPMATPPRT